MKRLVLSGGTSLADLLGRFEQKIVSRKVDFSWHDGPLTKLLRENPHGDCFLVLDGLSECDPEVLSVLLPLFLHRKVQLAHELEPLRNPKLKIIGTMTNEGLRQLPRSIQRASIMVEFQSLESSDLRIIAIHNALELLQKQWITEELLEVIVGISVTLQKKATELNLPSPSYSLRGLLRTLDLFGHAMATRHFDTGGNITEETKKKVLAQQLELVFLGSLADKSRGEIVKEQLQKILGTAGNMRDNSSSQINLDLPSSCRLGDVFMLKSVTTSASVYLALRKYSVSSVRENLLRLAAALQSRSLVVLSGKAGSGRSNSNFAIDVLVVSRPIVQPRAVQTLQVSKAHYLSLFSVIIYLL